MRKACLRNHLEQSEVKKRMLATKDREQFQRWQAIFLISKGLLANEVAEYVGVTTGTVYQWIFQYNHDGPEQFVLQGRGGRRFGLMSLDKEAETLENLRAEAECGQIIGAFAIREQVERTLSKKVSEDYLYDLLHRHGWRKVVPRPEHPKTNHEKQEEFKKKLPEMVGTVAAQSFSPEDKRPLKVFFQDEGLLGRICKPTACWVAKGFLSYSKSTNCPGIYPHF